MYKIILLLGLSPFFGLQSDCAADFSYSTIKKGNEYSVQINLKEGPSQDYTLSLYDVNTDHLVSEKRVHFSSGDKKIIFDHIQPSTYNIFYSSQNCKMKALKGLEIILD